MSLLSFVCLLALKEREGTGTSRREGQQTAHYKFLLPKITEREKWQGWSLKVYFPKWVSYCSTWERLRAWGGSLQKPIIVGSINGGEGGDNAVSVGLS